MRSFLALSLVAGLTAPAWARPDGNNDRHDGRGDTPSMMQQQRPEPWQRPERPQAERPQTQRMDLPFKSEVMQKAHPGDARDVTPKPQALDARVQDQKPAGDRMGRPVEKPVLPIKTEVMMKQQHGDNRDGASSAAASGSAAKQPATATMTAHDRQMLCKMAGLCLPQAHATDDVEDKTE